jgi:hypothetical protein
MSAQRMRDLRVSAVYTADCLVVHVQDHLADGLV